MAKRATNQADMFRDVADDLPLFSGTCIGVTVHRFDKDQVVPVQGRFAVCPICYDTGVVFRGDKLVYCTCEAGSSVAACRHATQGQEVETDDPGRTSGEEIRYTISYGSTRIGGGSVKR